MLIVKTYKIRIYPTKDQEEKIIKTFGCCRFVYNYFLDYKRTLWEKEKKSISRYELIKLLTPLKKLKDYTWLNDVDNIALQSSLEKLDQSYQNFFKHHKGYPKFKSKKGKQSYITKYNNNSIRINKNLIKIPKIGWIKFKSTYNIQGDIKRVNIIKTKTNKYFISILCENVPIKELNKTGKLIGVDLGIKNFLIDSNGSKVEFQNIYKKLENKIVKFQKQLSRKPKGSKNRNKLNIKISLLYECIVNKLRDFQHKLSIKLIKENDYICIEDLNIQKMLKDHKISKLIHEVSWAEFIRQLQYKCDWYGKRLIKVDKFFPPSQICSNCSYKNTIVKNYNIRQWTCPQCGISHDRDINAAKNILREGLKYLNS